MDKYQLFLILNSLLSIIAIIISIYDLSINNEKDQLLSSNINGLITNDQIKSISSNKIIGSVDYNLNITMNDNIHCQFNYGAFDYELLQSGSSLFIICHFRYYNTNGSLSLVNLQLNGQPISPNYYDPTVISLSNSQLFEYGDPVTISGGVIGPVTISGVVVGDCQFCVSCSWLTY
jgi:hypothetical protein